MSNIVDTSRCGRRWLSIEAPSPEDKLACLAEIAQEHGVDWTPDAPQGASVRPYLAGDRTTYSDPLTPPVGGWGGNSGERSWSCASSPLPTVVTCKVLAIVPSRTSRATKPHIPTR